MKIKGYIHVKQIRNGKVIKEFKTPNQITKWFVLWIADQAIDPSNIPGPPVSTDGVRRNHGLSVAVGLIQGPLEGDLEAEPPRDPIVFSREDESGQIVDAEPVNNHPGWIEVVDLVDTEVGFNRVSLNTWFETIEDDEDFTSEELSTASQSDFAEFVVRDDLPGNVIVSGAFITDNPSAALGPGPRSTNNEGFEDIFSLAKFPFDLRVRARDEIFVSWIMQMWNVVPGGITGPQAKNETDSIS